MPPRKPCGISSHCGRISPPRSRDGISRSGGSQRTWRPSSTVCARRGWKCPRRREPIPRPRPDTAVAIAVLPFSDMSPAKDQEYLCEGMAEEIMNALVRIDGIRVASRTSAFRAREDGGDLARSRARSRSTTSSRAACGRRGAGFGSPPSSPTSRAAIQLWSERFDREAADVFAVQDEIAAGVVEAVKARLAPGREPFQPGRRSATSRPTAAT